jgi:hypothetical protein
MVVLGVFTVPASCGVTLCFSDSPRDELDSQNPDRVGFVFSLDVLAPARQFDLSSSEILQEVRWCILTKPHWEILGGVFPEKPRRRAEVVRFGLWQDDRQAVELAPLLTPS